MVDHLRMFRTELGQDDIPRLDHKRNDGGDDEFEDSVRQRVSVNKVSSASQEKDDQGGHRSQERAVSSALRREKGLAGLKK